MRLITRNMVGSIGPQPAEDNGEQKHDQPDAVSGQADPVRRAMLFQKAKYTIFNQIVTLLAHDGDCHECKRLGDADGQQP